MDAQLGDHCYLCDGTSYYLDSGFYYCKECNTRSKGVQETTVEEFDPTFHGKTHTVRLKRIKKPSDTARDDTTNWTSWHGHNYVLLGLVDELIVLGADPSFKLVVLQLWTKYLNKMEAAFVSTTEEELPKFGLNQSDKDYELIYGVKRKRKPYVKKKITKKKLISLNKSVAHAISAEAGAFEKIRLFRKMRRVVVKTHYEEVQRKALALQDAMKRLDDRLKDAAKEQEEAAKVTEPEKPKVIEYTNEAQRVLDRRMNSRVKRGLDVEPELMEMETVPRLNFYNPHYLSRIKLLGLIVLALRICKQDIQISDLLRWISEGHLSYSNVTHLFPSHLRFSHGDRIFLTPPSVYPTYLAMLKVAYNVATCLGVLSLPRPNMVSLCRRYLTELSLPSSLLENVERLFATTSTMDLPHYKKTLENSEATAMAFIIVVLKMLLGLDGITEHRISDVASAVNGVMDEGSQPLFVWDEWVKFVECRKATISRDHFASRSRLQGTAAKNIGPYLSFLEKGWQRAEGFAERVKFSSKLDHSHSMTTKMECCLGQLPNNKVSEVPSLEFPPTLTPLTSYLDTIEKAGRLEATILATDFTKSSVKYLLQPEETLRFAQRKGLSVQYCHGAAIESYLVIRRVDCKIPGGSRGVQVALVDDGETTIPPEYCEEVHETQEKEDTKKLVLFIPYKHYWMLECGDHSEGLSREFETRVAARLSDTFQWLLAECSAMLEMTTKELYSQIVKVEQHIGNPGR